MRICVATGLLVTRQFAMTLNENHRLSLHAAIFDMDGLMLDTERLARDHFLSAAADFGFTEIEPIYLESIGLNWLDTKKLFDRALGTGFPFDEVRERWREYSKNHVREFAIPLKPGLNQLLDLLDRIGIPKAVATSTERPDAIALLENAGLLKRFVAVASGDEVQKGKPSPDIFLLAAQRLNIEPQHCVVFEDSPNGIRAAHAAGMIPILVPDVIIPTSETVGFAYRVFRSLEEACELLTGWDGRCR